MRQKNLMINIVGIDCPLETEEKLDTWYSKKHIPDLLKFKGIKGVTQYKLIGGAGSKVYEAKSTIPKFLTIYEFESKKDFEDYEASPELADGIKDALETFKETAASVIIRAQYEQKKTWKK